MTTDKNWAPITHSELDTLRAAVDGAIKRGPGWMPSLAEARDILDAVHPKLDPEPEAEPRRGLRASIYRSGKGDASNGGISSCFNQVIVTGPGIPEVFEASEDCPAVEIGTISFNGETTYHVRPADGTGKRYMFGGTFVHTSDSRFRKMFPFNGAVALHDRHEG